MKVKFGNGVKDVPIREVTAANYIVPAGEENAYHVLQDIPRYDPRTGKPLSTPRIQKYGAREFKDLSRNLKQQGYELTILYDPTEYLRKQAEAEGLTAVSGGFIEYNAAGDGKFSAVITFDKL